MSVLVNRNTFELSNVSLELLTKLIEDNITRDMFTIERATLLYNICWLSTRNADRRNHSFELFDIPVLTVVSSLKVSLIGCREVPELFQKVSRLLAVLYTLSRSSETFYMLASNTNLLSVSQWASYFHQASLGTLVNSQMFSLLEKQKDQNTTDVDGSLQSSSTFLSMHRLACKSAMELEEFILSFFQGLPQASIICISVLGDDYASWLNGLFPGEASQSWIMLSRLNSDCAPIVVVLPITSIGNPPDETKSSDSHWVCPWGQSGVVDEIAPSFRTILEGRFIVDELQGPEYGKEVREFDGRLRSLLRKMERDWFGPWKDLLLGDLLGHPDLEDIDQLQKDLKTKCKIDVHENMLQAVTRVGGESENCLSELIMKDGCYVGGRECINDGSLSVLLKAMPAVGNGDRLPVILVPDLDIQMLPWENLPVLIDQEVYRVPSVASISYLYDKSYGYQGLFPMIDPSDAYYFLCPSDDLSIMEKEAHRIQSLISKGTYGASLSVDELIDALRNHDLFLYFGHGYAMPYDHDKISRLERCATALLMSCSSGSLFLKGSYLPSGIALSYLYAGSPLLIGTLWDVVEDIDFFGIDVLRRWLYARNTTRDSTRCAQCKATDKSFTARKVSRKLPIGKHAKRGKKKRPSKVVEMSEVKLGCLHNPRMRSYVRASRSVVNGYMDRAALVCYGVPTGIFMK